MRQIPLYGVLFNDIDKLVNRTMSLDNEDNSNNLPPQPSDVESVRLGESVHIDTDGQPSVYHQGVAGKLMTAKEAAIKMKNGVYGLFIMLQHQAFFFPISAHMTKSHQSMLFQQIDATRKACLDALKAAQGNLSQCVAEVILVSPPKKEEDEIVPVSGDKVTSSFQRAVLSQDASERIALKVKQSLTTVGLETQWREHFRSEVPPLAGTTPILHVQQEDEGDDGESGSGDADGKPKHTWSLLYTTETSDGPITEEIHKYKHIPEEDLDKDIKQGPGSGHK